MTTEQEQITVEQAERILRAEYYSDVRDTAKSITDELKWAIETDGKRGEDLREWLTVHIDETVDGAGRVIYTAQAMQCIMYSDNDGAYAEEYGAENIVEDGAINWSRLAYGAFRQDIMEYLETNNIDVNSPGPECGDCGDVIEDGGTKDEDGKWLCDHCKEEAKEYELA